MKLLWAIPLLFLALGCRPIGFTGSSCHEERRDCEGDVLVQCVRDADTWPAHFNVVSRMCADTCVDDDDGDAFCQPAPTPSEFCRSVPDGQHCEADAVYTCRDGMLASTLPCDTAQHCVADGAATALCIEADDGGTLPPDDRDGGWIADSDAGVSVDDGGRGAPADGCATDGDYCLGDDAVGRCEGGISVDSWTCPEGTFCGHVEGRDTCYGSPAWLPDVDCPSAGMEGFADTRYSCLDGATRVTCHHGLIVDAIPCAGCSGRELGGTYFACAP